MHFSIHDLTKEIKRRSSQQQKETCERYLQTISSLGTYNPGPTQVGGLISTCASCIEGGRPSERLFLK